MLVATFPVAAEQPPLSPGRVLHRGPLEKEFVEIENGIPGFAGWHFDQDGAVIVRVKHADTATAAVERVRGIVETRRKAHRGRAAAGNGPVEVKARPALYSFSELASFRRAVWNSLPPEVHSIDVDEVNNVLKLGVSTEAEARRVRAAVIARLHVPAAALNVAVTPAPRSRNRNLADYNRPLYGGNSHAFRRNTHTGYCTIGVNIAPNGNPQNSGYFTASHCTSVTWGLDGGTHYQHDYMFYRIATEANDPSPWTAISSCPAGVLCRWSDAAFVRYDDDQRGEADGGSYIPETTWWGYYTYGSVTMNGNLMPVLGDHAYSAANDWLEKMGITSGWTYGQVLGTCEDYPSDLPAPGNQTVWILCSDRTDIWSEPGDSGSPVFQWTPNGVYWAGILWGGPGDDYRYSYHSPTWNVRTELPNYSFY